MAKLISETCCACGIEFAMTEDWMNRLKENHNSFYCPRGHIQHYTGETEAARLRRERDRLKQQMAYHKDYETQLENDLEDQRRKTAAQKGVVTKLKKRAANGVCPCCNRSFENLRRHMEGQHPDYVAEQIKAS